MRWRLAFDNRGENGHGAGGGNAGDEVGIRRELLPIIPGGINCHPIGETEPSPPLRSRRLATQNRHPVCP